MFCPNCGKETKENDNFCKYCGASLKSDERISSYIEIEPAAERERAVQSVESVQIQNFKVDSESDAEIFDTDEELVMYVVNKHWMSLFWPAFMTPIFLTYFWNVFLTTRGFFSFFVVIGMLAVIIYPSMRFKSDKMVITNKFAHITMGIKEQFKADVEIDKFNHFEVVQSGIGKLLGYGTIVFYSASRRFEYSYIEYPECIKRIFNNPKKYLSEL